MTGETTPIFSFAAGRDDRDRRHLRAGPRRRGDEDQRQPRPLRIADAEHVGQRLAARREQRHELCGVERGAAAEAEDAGGPGPRRGLDRREDGRGGWVGDDVGKHLRFDPRSGEEAMTCSTMPVETMPGSVTTSTRAPSCSRARAPIFAIDPAPNWTLALVLKVNGFIGPSRIGVGEDVHPASKPARSRRARSGR